jgi:hypothetical protein
MINFGFPLCVTACDLSTNRIFCFFLPSRKMQLNVQRFAGEPWVQMSSGGINQIGTSPGFNEQRRLA